MKFCYINSKNEKIDLSTYPYIFQSGDLLDYLWEYDNKKFIKTKNEYNIKIAIMPDFKIPLEQRKQVFKGYVNKILDTFDYDVINGKNGRLYVDESSYLECFIIASKKSEWNIGKPFMFNDFTIVSSNPFWTQETTYTFKSSEIKSSNNKRYPYKYPYRYANGLTNTSLTNSHFVDCNFKLLIYGRCINPTVIIGGNIYKVHTLIEEGERLEIDSKNKTVVKVRNSGYIENLFNSRDKVSDVFRKIKTGVNSVNWNGDFDFDIILYEERSEPKWI